MITIQFGQNKALVAVIAAVIVILFVILSSDSSEPSVNVFAPDGEYGVSQANDSFADAFNRFR